MSALAVETPEEEAARVKRMQEADTLVISGWRDLLNNSMRHDYYFGSPAARLRAKKKAQETFRHLERSRAARKRCNVEIHRRGEVLAW